MKSNWPQSRRLNRESSCQYKMNKLQAEIQSGQTNREKRQKNDTHTHAHTWRNGKSG
jgi:hypothetical protein